MKSSSFFLIWKSFILGLFLGILGFLISLFSKEDRRDKVYSALLGWFAGSGILLLMIHFGYIDFPAMPLK